MPVSPTAQSCGGFCWLASGCLYRAGWANTLKPRSLEQGRIGGHKRSIARLGQGRHFGIDYEGVEAVDRHRKGNKYRMPPPSKYLLPGHERQFMRSEPLISFRYEAEGSRSDRRQVPDDGGGTRVRSGEGLRARRARPRDERKAGGPDRHDEQKAQCANGHGSILEICSPVAIWAVHSRVIKPTLHVFIQVNIEGGIDIYIEHRSKFLRDGKGVACSRLGHGDFRAPSSFLRATTRHAID